ncbi:thymidine phosphorylase [Vreelandella maris]|uniref:Thymidine phosphorylase n=1 Tax=Vreelandella maris TaxID=2729617 RepID=A0A7Y6RFN3_9GAMM|nr:thymidine phosphorylase [Halomonas maris]NVF16102.1 thymidine phosphorylase [Halomonas maris]|tara:strand:- start:410 stop:1765 length:1356 start_codon:yes stop_codon:yes gene_type:complete
MSANATQHALLPQELIRLKRDNQPLPAEEIKAFVQGIADDRISDAQIGAFTMAVFLNGMSREEVVALTTATRDSGHVMQWSDLNLPGPIVDKHSTGGVGDLVSLVLGPWVAACGAFVPMISGRGLGHTGGTLDKLESIPGYDPYPAPERFREVVKSTGVAIIGQTGDLAPADKRIYGVRDVTATVESIPLITASILGKKLASGLDALVMDVKVGSGAFMPTPEKSRELAKSIANVATQAGTPTTALLTDMSQPLAPCAGNAVEIVETLALLRGERPNSRVMQVTRELAVEMLMAGKLAGSREDALTQLEKALTSGAAAEVFARMVRELGGPSDFMERSEHYLAKAEVIKPVYAEQSGIVQRIDTRAVGMSVVELGGGRLRNDASVDHSVGFTDIIEIGESVDSQRPIAMVHARSDAAAERAAQQLRAAFTIGEGAVSADTLLQDTFRGEAS